MMDDRHDRRWWNGWILRLVLASAGFHLARSRPILLDGDRDSGLLTKDLTNAHTLPTVLLVGIATVASLILLLILCVCGEKPQKEQSKRKPDGEIAETPNNGVPPSPSPDLVGSDIALIVPQSEESTQRTSSIQSASSSPGGHDDPLIRCSTIERRLPELPPHPMALATPTNEEEEDDYNRTYDVIGDTNAVKASPTKDRKNVISGTIEETEDEQYACVNDSNAHEQPRRLTNNMTDGAEYNSIGAKEQDVNSDEEDEQYASVVINDNSEPQDASYETVSTREEREGYARLRTVQKQVPKQDTSSEGDKNGYARLRDVTVENNAGGRAMGGAMGGAIGGATVGAMGRAMGGAISVGVAVGVAVGRATGGATEDEEEVPPVPYKPPDLQNDDENDVLEVESTGASGALAGANADPAAGVTANILGNTVSVPTKKREPPYTQVSARESLEVVRAREQAEKSALIAAHYQTIEEDRALDADHDGIYEPVDDQQLDNQVMMAPPPLPGDRQGASNEPSASNNWQMIRGPRVYEEINEETRPKPPSATDASNDDLDKDDIEPYAVTEKRPKPGNKVVKYAANATSEANYAKVNKISKDPDQTNNNAGTEVRTLDPESPPVDENGLPLYAVVEKKGKGRESRIILREEVAGPSKPTPKSIEDNYQAVEDNYQSVGDMPSNGASDAMAIAGGMVRVNEQPVQKDLWTKRENMYIDMETNKPSSPTEPNQSPSEGHQVNHSYEMVSVATAPVSKKEKQKQAKKAKKEAKRERKHSKGEKEKGKKAEKYSEKEDTVWRRQVSMEDNGNSNNNTEVFDAYENVEFPIETRL